MADDDFSTQIITNDETSLLLACKNNSSDELETIDFLINQDCNVNAVDDDGYSALHYAVQNCSLKIVLKLLEYGADVHLRTEKYKLTALHLAVMKKHNLDVVKSLIEAGSVLESPVIDEITPLHMSLLKCSSEVVEYLMKNGADVNCLDKILQLTPLHLSIYQNRDDLFKLMIDYGADVNCSGTDGLTPLHLSSMLGSFQFTEELIQHGADVNSLYKDQFTPLHLTAMKSKFLDNEELMGADTIRYGNEESLIVQLMKDSYDTTNQNYEASIQLLVHNGADVNAVKNCGLNPLQCAVMYNRHPISFIKTLLELGAEVDFAEIESGFTVLHYALKNNNMELIEVLVDAGVNVNSLTQDHKSPLHLALEMNFTEAVKYLVEHGAKLNCNGKRCLYTLLYIAARNNDEELISKLLNFQQTPLIEAINSLKNEDIKKAVMCLSAIVNACNENGCMPINCEISSDYADSSKSLRINRVNVHGSEIYSKFACDRVLSGALQELKYNNIEQRNPRYVYDYLSMLNAVKLPLVKNYLSSRTQSIADWYSHNKLKTHYEECLEEVDKLKNYWVDKNVTLYDVLHMRSKRRRCYTKNLDLCLIESEFQIYYQLVLARYREDIIKKTLMDTVQLALSRLANIELPIICVEEIFGDLGVMNVIATIEAAEMND